MVILDPHQHIHLSLYRHACRVLVDRTIIRALVFFEGYASAVLVNTCQDAVSFQAVALTAASGLRVRCLNPHTA